MVVDNDVVADTRVRKEAASLADAGYRVTVLGKGEDGLPEEEWVNNARIVRAPVPRTVLDELWDQRSQPRPWTPPSG